MKFVESLNNFMLKAFLTDQVEQYKKTFSKTNFLCYPDTKIKFASRFLEI